MPWMNRAIVRCLTVSVPGAALLAACDGDRPTEPPARLLDGIPQAPAVSNVRLLTAQFFANEALIPDGSLTPDEPLPFGHTIHVIDRDNKGGWKIDGSPLIIRYEDENTCGGPGPVEPPPLPTGALHLMTLTGDPVSRLRSTRYHRTYLRDLARLDYWACEEQNTGDQWPYIVLSIDWDGDNQIDDHIIFEPSDQNPLSPGNSNPVCAAGSNQPITAFHKWQFWDALRGTPGDPTTFKACWYSTSDLPAVPVAQPLSMYIAEHPNAAIVNLDGNHGGVQITHGVGVGGYNGWVDAFTIGKDINNTNGQSLNSTITYDFEKP
jgi:hypothetical protein